MAKVLLIEPDRVLADTYRRALQTAGHHVYICASAQAGVLAADQVNPDLVVLELQLVAHNGAEFLYEFRSYPDWQQVPVIVHTHVPPAHFGGSLPAIRQQLGICEYLYKPTTTLRQLLGAVQDATVTSAT